MSIALATPAPAGVAANTQEDWVAIERVFRGMVARETTGAQIDAAIMVCKSLGFNPILQDINLIDGKVYVTHKGLWHLAHRSGMLDGIEVLAEGDTDSHYTARVAIYRKDMRYPFAFTGRYPKGGRNKQYGPEMALARAECLALRRAFDVSMPVYEEINWEEREGDARRGRAEIREVPRPAPAALPPGNPPIPNDEKRNPAAPGGQSSLELARAHALKQFGPVPETLPEVEAQLAPLARQARRNDEALSQGEYARYHDLEAKRKELLAAPALPAPAAPAFDFAAWSADLATQAADGGSTGAIAARINQLKDDLTGEQYEAVMLWFREVKDARKAARAPDGALLARVVDAGRSEQERADAARYFLAKASDAERLFERVAQLTVLDFPAPILDVLVEEQRERLGLPDEDEGAVAGTPARAPLRHGVDELGDVPF